MTFKGQNRHHKHKIYLQPPKNNDLRKNVKKSNTEVKVKSRQGQVPEEYNQSIVDSPSRHHDMELKEKSQRLSPTPRPHPSLDDRITDHGPTGVLYAF